MAGLFHHDIVLILIFFLCSVYIRLRSLVCGSLVLLTKLQRLMNCVFFVLQDYFMFDR